MHIPAPFVQDGQISVDSQTAPADPTPLITAPSPILWIGFSVFAATFLIVLLLIIRARVIAPAAQREPGKAVFEPAGADADITFGDEDSAPASKADKAPAERPEPQPPLKSGAHERPSHDDKSQDGPDDKPQKDAGQSRAPFSGLFARKPAEAESNDNSAERGSDQTPFPKAELRADSPTPAPSGPTGDLRPWDDGGGALRNLKDDVEARRREAEEQERRRFWDERRQRDDHQEREQLIERARQETRREAEFERRKTNAALEDRLKSLSVMEDRLGAALGAVEHDLNAAQTRLGASLDERFIALSKELRRQLEKSAESAGASGAAIDAEARKHLKAEIGAEVRRELTEISKAITETLQRFSERINALDAAPAQIKSLTEKLDDLSRILATRSASASAARLQLRDLVKNALTPDRYEFAVELTTGRKADCLIKLPMGPPIAVDARFPVEAYQAWLGESARTSGQQRAANDYRRAVLRHIADVAEKLIIPGETADGAFLFIPSEAIANDLHAHFPDLVQDSYRARVWIVAPTSLMASLTAFSALSDNMSARADERAPELDFVTGHDAAPSEPRDEDKKAEEEKDAPFPLR